MVMIQPIRHPHRPLPLLPVVVPHSIRILLVELLCRHLRGAQWSSRRGRAISHKLHSRRGWAMIHGLCLTYRNPSAELLCRHHLQPIATQWGGAGRRATSSTLKVGVGSWPQPIGHQQAAGAAAPPVCTYPHPVELFASPPAMHTAPGALGAAACEGC